MSPENKLVLGLVALALIVAYAFWRSIRLINFRMDVLEVRSNLASWAKREGVENDTAYISIDRLLFYAVESAEAFSLLDLILVYQFGKVSNRPRGEVPSDPGTLSCMEPSAQLEIRQAAQWLVWRTLRLLVLESISGFVCAVILIAWVAWHILPDRAPSSSDLVSKFVRFVAFSVMNRRDPRGTGDGPAPMPHAGTLAV